MTIRYHAIAITTITLLSFSSLFFPEPMNKLYFVFVIGSLAPIPIVGWSSMIRSGDKRLFSLNPITKTKAALSVTLNKIEKIILIYAVFIFTGCILAVLLSPLIGSMINK